MIASSDQFTSAVYQALCSCLSLNPDSEQAAAMIIPAYLEEFWQFARKKTAHFQQTQLKIEELKAVSCCRDCARTYPTMTYAKICPYCKSEHTFLLSGSEYNIKEIEAM